MSFFSNLYEEFAARRRKLSKRLGALLGGIVEFALLGGLMLGVAAVFLNRPWGAAPLVGWLIGYWQLDRRRQKALADKAVPAEVTERSSDLLAFAFTAAMAALGFWAFTSAMAYKEAVGWGVEPPPRIVDLEIAK